MPRQYDLKELSDAKHHHGSKALEMIMHDVIDGMQELANIAGYDPKPGGHFEILEIEPDDEHAAAGSPTEPDSTETDKVVPIKGRRKQAAA